MLRVVISSPKGGCGKTTLTRNLAAAAAQDGYDVATADLDSQRTLTRWARRRPNSVPSIEHYEVEWSDAAALIEADGIEPADLLFIDTPPTIEAQPVIIRQLLAAADLILVPCRASFDDVESAVPYLLTLRESGARPVCVLNFAKPRLNVAAEKGVLIGAAELCPVEFGERADYNRAGARGLGLADVPGHPGGDEVRTLWAYVKQRIGLGAAVNSSTLVEPARPTMRRRARNVA